MRTFSRKTLQTAFLWAFLFFFGAQFLYPKDQVLDFVYFVCVIPALLAVLASSEDRGRLGRAGHPLLLIGVLMAWVAVAGARSPALALDGVRQAAMTAPFILALLTVFLVTANGADHFAKIAVGAAAAGAAVSLTLHIAGGGGGRLVPVGQFDQAVQGAAAYGFVALIALARLLHARGRAGAAAYGGALILIITAMAMTQSRMALAAFTVCAGGLVLTKLGLRRALVLAGFSAILLAVLALFEGPRGLFENAVALLTARGDAYRLDIWAASWMQIQERPFFGHGRYADFAVVLEGSAMDHPHNLILGLWRQAGAPAVLLMAAIFVVIVRGVLRTFRGSARLTHTIPPVYAFLVTLTDYADPIGAPDESWTFFWAPLCLAIAAAANAGVGHAVIGLKEDFSGAARTTAPSA